MKKFFILFLLCLSALAFSAQENSIKRIKIQHADPQLIFMLLIGQTDPFTNPEMSTLFTSFGFNGGFGGGFGNSNFGGGNFNRGGIGGGTGNSRGN